MGDRGKHRQECVGASIRYRTVGLRTVVRHVAHGRQSVTGLYTVIRQAGRHHPKYPDRKVVVYNDCMEDQEFPCRWAS